MRRPVVLVIAVALILIALIAVAYHGRGSHPGVAALPRHTPADLESPDWWVARAAAEPPASNANQALALACLRAEIRAAAHDEVALGPALEEVDRLAVKLPPDGAIRDKVAYTRDRARHLLIEPPHTAPTPPPHASTQVTDPLFARAARLRRSGDAAGYERLRAVAISAPLPSPSLAAIQTLRFDLSTGNFAPATQEFHDAALQPKGAALLLLRVSEDLTAQNDLAALRELAAFALRNIPHDGVLLLPPVIAAHLFNHALEDFALWINALPDPDARFTVETVTAQILAGL